MFMNRLSGFFSAVTLIAGVALFAPVANAQTHDHAHASANSVEKPAQMSSGEVKKVDTEAAKITIKHGPLVNLNMPGMTMVFKVKDPAMLNQVQAGDKISFVAEKVDGALTVTKLEAAK
jgi:Cu(I)/Ag(I) efflux system protein CusF